ncbi:MAG: aromatic ring-hydroxylating dioxygenase subunit alpha [Myxococcota bacterium]
MRVPIDSWYAILEAKEVRRGKPHAARRLGLDLVLWRDADTVVRAVTDRCPHRGTALSAGRVRDGCIECPFHGFRFDGDGACVKVPCNGPDAQRPRHLATRSFVLREEHGLVWLWWGEARAEYPPVPWFPELEVGYEHSGFTVDSEVNWMRNVENQLDWAHLPFIHGTTIGSGFNPQIKVHSRVQDDRIITWVDDPQGARGQPTVATTFAFANIWHLPFGGQRMSGFIAFAPVDETHTRMYFRTYTRRLLVPGIAKAVCTVMDLFNRVVVRQDTRVVATQPPGETTQAHDERLVQADLPIAQFRKEVARRSLPRATLRGPSRAAVPSDGTEPSTEPSTQPSTKPSTKPSTQPEISPVDPPVLTG